MSGVESSPALANLPSKAPTYLLSAPESKTTSQVEGEPFAGNINQLTQKYAASHQESVISITSPFMLQHMKFRYKRVLDMLEKYQNDKSAGYTVARFGQNLGYYQGCDFSLQPTCTRVDSKQSCIDLVLWSSAVNE